MTALAVTLLAAAAVAGTAAYYCLTRASRLLNEALNEQADNTTPEQAAEEAVDRGLDRLFTALGPPPEPTPADRTPVGDDDWTREMRRRIWHTAQRRNTGPRRRLP